MRLLLAIEDVTGRKQAEETMRASTERLKVAPDASALGRGASLSGDYRYPCRPSLDAGNPQSIP